jgi:parallel beta-helix repeat protein
MGKAVSVTSFLALALLGLLLVSNFSLIAGSTSSGSSELSIGEWDQIADIAGATSTPYITADIYEPDNEFSQATYISFGDSQVHNINQIGDVDMLAFTLSITRSIVVQASGAGSPDIWIGLYIAPDPYHTYWLADNSDSATPRLVYENLGPGSYFIWINEKGNDDTIVSYTVSLNEYVRVLDLTASLLIDGNDDLILKASQAFWPGSGTASDPYIIGGRLADLPGADPAIRVANTDLHLIIRDCTVLNASVGIRIFNATNVTLEGLNITAGTGVMLESYCKDIVITGCRVNSTSMAIWLIEAEGTILSDNRLNGSPDIKISEAGGSSLTGNVMEGGGISADPDWVSMCTQSIDDTNLLDGRPIFYRKNADLAGATIPEMVSQVILGNVSNAVVENLNLGHAYCGLQCSFSSNLTIRGNHLTAGINLWECDSCVISNNTMEGVGISIGWSSSNVTVIGNIISGPYYGITVGGQGNHIINNTISGSTNGIFISYSDGNEIRSNLVSDCADYGLMIFSGTNNIITKNAFVGNRGAGTGFSSSHVQAYDDGTSNSWYVNHSGNYWSDWNGQDQDGDGAVDQPYTIDGGNNKDRYPWKGLTDDEPAVLTLDGQGSITITNQTLWTLTWDAYDVKSGVKGFFDRADGGPWNDLGLSRSVTFQGLTEGSHLLEVRAIDNAGNEVIRNLTVVVDVTPPSFTVSPTGSGVNVTSTIEVIFNEMVEHVTLTIDGLSVPAVQTGDRTYTASVTLSGYREYVITVHAEDLAGNPAQAQWSFVTEHVERWINGTARGMDGRLLSGARVNDSFSHSAVIDADGKFSLLTYTDERFLTFSADGMEQKVVQVNRGGTIDLEVTMVSSGGGPGDQGIIYIVAAIAVAIAVSIGVLVYRRRKS